MVTDITGAPVWTADHLPFGETVSETGTANDPLLRYPGQWAVPRAEELNLPTLYYNGYRWYRPQWGRYSQSDPLRPRPRRVNGVVLAAENEFSYARLNPMKFFDERGLEASVQPAQATEDCNFSRYNNCCSETGLKKWCCRKIVDFACSGAKNTACCEQEFLGCKTCKDPEDPEFEAHYARCVAYRILCIAGRSRANCP